jgi:hypothetical protein
VKPIAAWLPHLIIPRHIPTCPHCESSGRIDINRSKWVDRPKVLHGIDSHRYLDSYSYYCSGCCRSFYGYNEKSLELDSNKLLGIFNFHLSKGFALDNALYSCIVNHSHEPTAHIHRALALSTADRYIDSAIFYYRAVQANTVVPPRNFVDGNSTQTTLDAHLVKNSSLSWGEATSKAQ